MVWVPRFTNYRHQILQVINPILLAHGMGFQDDDKLLSILLYGHKKFTFQENQSTLIATIAFIKKSNRFSYAQVQPNPYPPLPQRV